MFFFHVAPKKALCVCYLFLYKSKNLGSEFLNCGFGPWLRWWLTLVVDCLWNPRLEKGCDIQNSNQHRTNFVKAPRDSSKENGKMLLLIDFTHLAGGSLCFWLCVYVLDICKQGLKLKQLYNTRPLQFFFTAPVLWALTAGACLGKYQQAAVCLARLTGHSLAHGWILPGVLIGKTPRFWFWLASVCCIFLFLLIFCCISMGRCSKSMLGPFSSIQFYAILLIDHFRATQEKSLQYWYVIVLSFLNVKQQGALNSQPSMRTSLIRWRFH